MTYELFYGSGGHSGPYHDLQSAKDRAARLLGGSKSETHIYIQPRLAEGIGGYGKPIGYVRKVEGAISYTAYVQ